MIAGSDILFFTLSFIYNKITNNKHQKNLAIKWNIPDQYLTKHRENS